MTPTITWDSTQFTSAMRELAKISGKDFATVVKREMAAAVRICAGALKIKSDKKIGEEVRNRYMANFRYDQNKISTNLGKKGVDWVTWFRESSGDEWVPIGTPAPPRMTVKTGRQAGKVLTGTPAKGWRNEDIVWLMSQGIEKARDAYIILSRKNRLRARFMKLQGWVQIGDALGLDLNSVPPQTKTIKTQEARDAADRKGRTYRTGRAYENASGSGYDLTITNESWPEIATGGQQRLNAALNRRAKAFENNLAHGVFNDVKARMARYPGMFVTGDTAPVTE